MIKSLKHFLLMINYFVVIIEKKNDEQNSNSLFLKNFNHDKHIEKKKRVRKRRKIKKLK